MKLLWIEIDGFGKLVGQRFAFGEGLNLIYGENEAGKTTLLQAIVALLFGYPLARGRPTRKELAAYRPWDSRRFGGRLAFELDDGRSYLVARSFRGNGSEKITPLDGKAKTGDLPPVKDMMGVTDTVFASCALVNHNSILQLAKPGELSEAILRAVDTGEVETSAQNAAARLTEVRQDLGEATDTETTWGRLEKEIDDLLERRESALAQQRVLLSELAKQRRLEERLEQYRRQMAVTELAIVVRRHSDAAERLRQIVETERHLAELRQELTSCEQYAALPANGREQVAQAWHGLEAVDADLAELNSAREQVEKKITEVEEKLQQLQPYVPFCQPGEYDYFAESRAAWFAALKRLQRCADEARKYEEHMQERGLSSEHLRALSRFTDTDFKRLQEKEAEFQRWHRRMRELQEDVLRHRAEHPFPPSLKVTLTVSTLFFAGVNFLIWYLHQLQWGLIVGGGSILIVGFLSIFLSVRETAHRRRLRRLEQELTEAHERAYQLDREVLDGLQAYGAQSLTELLTRRIEFLEAGSMFREVQMAQDDQHRLAARLLRLLQPLGVERIDEDTLTEVSDRVEQTRRYRAELNALLDRKDEVRRRLLTAELEARRHRAIIRKALETAGVGEQEEVDSQALLDEVYAKRERYEQLCREISSSEKLLAGLLGGRSRQEWEDVTATLERRVNKLLNAVEDPEEIPDQTPRRLEHRYERLRSLISKVETDLASARERTTAAIGLAPSLAEIDEAIAWRQHRAAALRQCAAALTLAHEELMAAAEEQHRDFAPRLSAAVSRHLPKLTAGRYSKAVLDPRDFSLGLEIPERGLQPAERLSLGTREQLYLLLRIAIADTLGSRGETLPLLLDDPFVHFDAPRLERMFAFLLSLAETRQVLLFSKDFHTRYWLREHLTPSAGHRYIELTP
jgi:uncharacterized protein YhaN